jgi:dihydroorotate dehydrogenase electron transfer subunit
VTEPLEDALARGGVERVLVAGSGAMGRAVAERCVAAGVACQVALEAPMACGFGACYGCAVELDGAWLRLCVEGPVVDGARLVGAAVPA